VATRKGKQRNEPAAVGDVGDAIAYLCTIIYREIGIALQARIGVIRWLVDAAVGSRRVPEWWESDGASETRGSCQSLSNAAVICRENVRPLCRKQASDPDDSGCWVCLVAIQQRAHSAGGGVTAKCD
jgi:hypothetical protein